ncbi:MAG: sigma-70 family RNA polymerase sigma factor [Bdellovibrionales bacterium]|nr:sigma-70 family RNA polymerase sigma factor [Bdellovibrionales bacterium]
MNPFKNLTDEKLMILYQEDEFQAFEVLYARHRARVFSYLTKRLPHRDDIEEVFQNIFVKLHKSRSRYDSKYKFLQWLYTLSRNELLDHVKKKNINTTQFNEEFHPVEERDISDVDLDDLPLGEQEKKVLDLRINKDYDYKEISHLLNIGPSNARKIFSRAIEKLKRSLYG